MPKKHQVESSTLSHHLSSHNLIILGGTFDPVHNGHYSIIKSIKSVFPESKIIVVPTFQSPFKTKPLLVARQRLLLLKKLVLSIPNLTIDPYELYKEKTSYSIDTIKYIKDKNP
ncbi:adenylyltransferase/cytidyltransferase family protein, partial [bacterium]|nr:adenylyltransferase/cytidyltransferase family protein [bacterium]